MTILKEDEIARMLWDGFDEPYPQLLHERDCSKTSIVSKKSKSIARAGIKYLSAILTALDELNEGPLRDDYGMLRPSNVAFEKTTETLVDASIIAALLYGNTKIPMAHVSTDSQGGVRIEWNSADKSCSVFLVIGFDCKTNYIYSQQGEKYKTQRATPENLAECLNLIK